MRFALTAGTEFFALLPAENDLTGILPPLTL